MFYLLLSLLVVTVFSASTKTALDEAFDGKIKHVIVVMFENRSFDHMLGYLRENRTDVDGCQPQFTSNCSNPYDPTDPKSDTVVFNSNAVYVQPGDPSHSISGTRTQLFGPDDNEVWPPPMDGFVYDYSHIDHINGDNGAIIMSGFSTDAVPIITTLANDFGVSDRWFCDVPGPTDPNRLYSWLSTSKGLGGDDVGRLIIGIEDPSIFSILDDYYTNTPQENNTWRVYFGDGPSPLFVEYTRLHPKRFHPMEKFYKDIENGDLPIYTWIDPNYLDVGKIHPATDQHPDHDVTYGEQVMKEIYESLRNSTLWNETLLIITYDEHGGFFDHVPPPLTVSPDGINATDVKPPFDFTRLGIRVPTVFISPWIPKGTITNRPSPDSNQYTASSILHTLREQFTPGTPPLTKRDEWSLTFEQLLSLDTPSNQGPKTLPDVPSNKQKLPFIPGKQPVSQFQLTLAHTIAHLVERGDEVNNYTKDQETLGKFIMECSYQWINQ